MLWTYQFHLNLYHVSVVSSSCAVTDRNCKFLCDTNQSLFGSVLKLLTIFLHFYPFFTILSTDVEYFWHIYSHADIFGIFLKNCSRTFLKFSLSSGSNNNSFHKSCAWLFTSKILQYHRPVLNTKFLKGVVVCIYFPECTHIRQGF